jgi:hypothetical protein
MLGCAGGVTGGIEIVEGEETSDNFRVLAATKRARPESMVSSSPSSSLPSFVWGRSAGKIPACKSIATL